jgi:GntR family L-lactate dehydrogenase operon transcriptional regulator
MRLSDRLAERLQALIVERQLPGGARLPAERSLAAELGVSRPSLREAIRKLASEGILESRRGGGTYVRRTPADASDIVAPLAQWLRQAPGYGYDVLEARRALEGDTAWHAARRATDDDRARIRACGDALLRLRPGNDAERLAQADVDFHLAIAEASHNAVLTQLMRSLFALLRSNVATNRDRLFTMPGTFDPLAGQHREVMSAILAGDAERARQAMHRHLDYVQHTLRAIDEDAERRARFARLAPSADTP